MTQFGIFLFHRRPVSLKKKEKFGKYIDVNLWKATTENRRHTQKSEEREMIHVKALSIQTF